VAPIRENIASAQYPVPSIQFFLSSGSWAGVRNWVLGTGYWLLGGWGAMYYEDGMAALSARDYAMTNASNNAR